MAKTVKFSDVTENDIYKIMNICHGSLGELYSIFANKYDYYKSLKFGSGEYADNTFLVLGDDWYLIYANNNIAIEFMEFYAVPPTNIKRSISMLNVFKKILESSKGKVCAASFRHATTYKIVKYLEEKDYIKVIKDQIKYQTESELLDYSTYNQDTSTDSSINQEENLLHEVCFLIKGEEDEVSFDQKVWLIKNLYL